MCDGVFGIGGEQHRGYTGSINETLSLAQAKDRVHTDVIPTEAEAIVSGEIAMSRSHDIPYLFDGKVIR